MDARAVAANASQADYSTFLTKRQFIIHGAESIPARKGWKDMEEERREQILQMLRLLPLLKESGVFSGLLSGLL